MNYDGADNEIERKEGIYDFSLKLSGDMSEEVYHNNIIFFNKTDKCIKEKNKNEDSIIGYDGISKNRYNVENLIQNDISIFMVYNLREIPMLRCLGGGYIIRVKDSISGIGISKEHFHEFFSNPSNTFENFLGVSVWFNINLDNFTCYRNVQRNIMSYVVSCLINLCDAIISRYRGTNINIVLPKLLLNVTGDVYSSFQNTSAKLEDILMQQNFQIELSQQLQLRSADNFYLF